LRIYNVAPIDAVATVLSCGNWEHQLRQESDSAP